MGYVQFIGTSVPHAVPITAGNVQMVVMASAANQVMHLDDSISTALLAAEPSLWQSATSFPPNLAGVEPASSQLLYAPPAQSSPTQATVTAGSFFSGSYGAGQDVIVKMPSSTQTSEIQITGGRHVRLIGGAQQPASGKTGAALRITGVSGSIFIEGLALDMSVQTSPADAMNLCGSASSGYYPDVYLQNCRITGVHGQASTTHSDIYQPQGAIGRLFVDKFTGDSNYQGFFLPPQNAITAAYLSRVNLSYNALTPADANSYLLWLQDNTSQDPYPVFLTDVFVAPRAGQAVDAAGVWPNSSQATIGCYVRSDGGIAWLPGMRVSGAVTPGTPAAGDFVPSNVAGVNYVSPGYLCPPCA